MAYYLRNTSNLNADRIKTGTMDPDRLPEGYNQKITVSPTEPTDPQEGDLWIDTSN